jgi:hypothetical protein
LLDASSNNSSFFLLADCLYKNHMCWVFFQVIKEKEKKTLALVNRVELPFHQLLTFLDREISPTKLV